jgi:hypothetical protein
MQSVPGKTIAGGAGNAADGKISGDDLRLLLHDRKIGGSGARSGQQEKEEADRRSHIHLSTEYKLDSQGSVPVRGEAKSRDGQVLDRISDLKTLRCADGRRLRAEICLQGVS